MAPADSKRRDNNYFNVGVQGRKTGITLKDTGVRDEHGMEPIDGIFSSPEKSPPKRNNQRQQLDKTLTSSDMDLQQSSMPEPADALSARKSSIRPSRSSIFPPPASRSPIKTSLGSPARRQASMGPPSSMRRTSKTPDRAISHPAVARRLDFGTSEEDNSSINGSGSRNRGKPRPNIFDLPISPPHGKKRTHDDSVADEETMLEDSELVVNGVGEDDDTEPEQEQEQEQEQELETALEAELEAELEAAPDSDPEPEPEPQPPKARGRPRRSLDNKAAAEPEPKKKRGRPKKNQGLVSAKSASAAAPARSQKGPRSKPVQDEDAMEDSAMDVDQTVQSIEGGPSMAEPTSEDDSKEGLGTQPDEETQLETEPEPEPEPEAEPESEPEPEPEPQPVKKKRGRAKASAAVEVHQDEPQQPVELPERPAKKAKTTKKPPPSQRNSNAKITAKKSSAKEKQPAKQKEDMPPPALPKKASMPPPNRSRQGSVARSLQVLRQGTPFDDDGARTTRSGRISTKPLEFWRNERIEYLHDGTKQEIIRAEDVEAEKRKVRRGTTRKRGPKRSASAIEEEEEVEAEEWELNEGVIQGAVNGWDDKASTIVDEGSRLEDIAFSGARLQTREVAGANFRYSKILGLPYFGAGMVDIPPHGSKRSKNSRRMYMAFCLLSGKVSATVGDAEFKISKGGVWMVPRGNFYSITNNDDVDARLFFAQGCETSVAGAVGAAAAGGGAGGGMSQSQA